MRGGEGACGGSVWGEGAHDKSWHRISATHMHSPRLPLSSHAPLAWLAGWLAVQVVVTEMLTLNNLTSSSVLPLNFKVRPTKGP